MAVIYYQQLWSDLQHILTNSVLNSLYCVYVIMAKGVFLKLAAAYFMPNSPVLVPGLNNPLAIVHPAMLLAVYLRGYRRTHDGLKSVVAMWAALFLGGWWASQEFNWGGWWNWDLIESPALVYSLIALLYLHKHRVSALGSVRARGIALILLALVLVNTRFLVSSSVHSFVSGPGVVEKFLLLATSNLLVYALVMASLLRLHNLLLLEFVFLYLLLRALLGQFNSRSKVLKYHAVLVIAALCQRFYSSYLGVNVLVFSGLSGLSYRFYTCHSYFIGASAISIAWFKEISYKI